MLVNPLRIITFQIFLLPSFLTKRGTMIIEWILVRLNFSTKQARVQVCWNLSNPQIRLLLRFSHPDIPASVEIIKTSSVINPSRHSRPSTSTFPAFPTGFSPSHPCPAHTLSILIQSRDSPRELFHPLHEFSPPQCHRRLGGRGWGKKSAAVRENPSPIPRSFSSLALKRLFRNDSRMIFNSLRGVCRFIFSFCGGERGSA